MNITLSNFVHDLCTFPLLRNLKVDLWKLSSSFSHIYILSERKEEEKSLYFLIFLTLVSLSLSFFFSYIFNLSFTFLFLFFFFLFQVPFCFSAFFFSIRLPTLSHLVLLRKQTKLCFHQYPKHKGT